MPGHYRPRKLRFARPLPAEEAATCQANYKLRKLRFARPLQAEEAETCQATTS